MIPLILPTESPDVGTGMPAPVLEILSDNTLSMGEKILLLEALLVHDAAPVVSAPPRIAKKGAAVAA